MHSIQDFMPLPEKEQHSYQFIEETGLIVLKTDNEHVYLGYAHENYIIHSNLLSRFHLKKLVFYPILHNELIQWLGEEAIRQSRQSDTESGKAANTDSMTLDTLANDAPIVNLVNALCIEGIRKGASDIHIETMEGKMQVRYRIDGALINTKEYAVQYFKAVSSRIKVMANLNILENRMPQDGRITVETDSEKIDFRVSIIPVTSGESIVLRILGRKNCAAGFEELGFSAKQIETLHKMLSSPQGLVLVTGPTGSGKTTTLNTMLKILSSSERKIISIEDPVEYSVPGVNQIQINEKIGLSFDVLLRRVLRQDPNIIMIGEIRDKATADIAIRAALTGHLVLSTMHTNDAASVIPRLLNMGIESYLLAAVLRGALAQRLVRKSAGGRTVIAELFCNSNLLEDLIIGKNTHAAILQFLKEAGMKTLWEEGMEKVKQGITTIEEISEEIAVE
ncbi:MAG: GspE/PulE family protein [Spirochaetaceae bacterium]|jgi:general secretion pathway protein E/type IV pilus assembly protein PilB|nr:GspE/PulE family protein [Spirochaetaceae bacterium]